MHIAQILQGGKAIRIKVKRRPRTGQRICYCFERKKTVTVNNCALMRKSGTDYCNV